MVKGKSKGKKNSKKPSAAPANQSEILQLIDSVGDGDLIVACQVPADTILDQQNFPLPVFDKLPIRHLKQKLTNSIRVDGDDWTIAWSDIVTDLIKDGDCGPNFNNFSTYSSQRKNNFRNQMIGMITRRKREVMYRKYVYALRRDGRDVPVYPQPLLGDDDVDHLDGDADTDYVALLAMHLGDTDAVGMGHNVTPDVATTSHVGRDVPVYPQEGDTISI